MEEKYFLKKKIIWLLVLSIVLLAISFLWRQRMQIEELFFKTTVVPASAAAQLPEVLNDAVEEVGVPIRIKIPSIAVDAPIEKVELTTGGAMAVPKIAMNAGWYGLGHRPGEVGSAAIAGHVNWLHGETGVFAELKRVKVGEVIVVEDDLGVSRTFVIRESRKFDPAADAATVFSSNDGLAHLNLITCDGVWQKDTKQYSERLVVFADRE